MKPLRKRELGAARLRKLPKNIENQTNAAELLRRSFSNRVWFPQGFHRGRPMTNCVAVDLRQIVDGWKLRFPIYDPRGVLLSAGTEFTSEHRQLLAARGVTRVVMNETDTACVAVAGGHGANRLNLLR